MYVFYKFILFSKKDVVTLHLALLRLLTNYQIIID
jgi:hypothetical protein